MFKNKKIKPFWKNTEAISPIIATILVLSVAVAAGVGLYFWFDTFQAGAQEQVGATTTSSMNVMVESSLGDKVLKVALPVDTFTYESKWLDLDNDGKIAEPTKSGNYSVYNSKYTKFWFDERWIQEIPIYIKNQGPSELTGVKIKYDVPTGLLLRIDRNNNNQLLKVDRTPAKINFTADGPKTADTTYYFDTTDYSVNISDIYWDFSNIPGSTAYSPFEDWLGSSQSLLKVLKFYDENGNERYARAEINGAEHGWNTANSFFVGAGWYDGLNSTNIDWCKQNLQDPVYDVGTLKPGESKKVYTYYFTGNYLTPDDFDCSSFADCTGKLSVTVSSDQGVSQTVTATFHLIDTDTV